MPVTEIKLTGVLGAGVIAACAAFLIFADRGFNSWLWSFGAGGIWIYCVWQTYRRLHLNRPHLEAPCFTDFGWANRLTLLRGGLIALTGGFLFQLPVGTAVWIPGLLYSAAAVLDRVDGWVARRSGRTSVLGKELDTEMDALGLLVAPLLAVWLGKFHWSFLAVSAAYYLFIAGLKWRIRSQLPVYSLPPSALRRALAGFQMGFVAVALLPVFSSSVTRLLGVIFMVPILAGFLMDWLAVSGRVSAQADLRHRLALFGSRIFQPLLRITIFLLVFHALNKNEFPHYFSLLLFSLLALLILLGCGARFASGVLMIAWSIVQVASVPAWEDAALLTAASGILLLGAGNFSLWRGDDAWVNRQDGD